jgi:hypothetical protein
MASVLGAPATDHLASLASSLAEQVVMKNLEAHVT